MQSTNYSHPRNYDTFSRPSFIWSAVSLGCGGMSSENCTYFTSGTGISAGQCRLTICRCDSNICQVKKKLMITNYMR